MESKIWWKLVWHVCPQNISEEELESNFMRRYLSQMIDPYLNWTEIPNVSGWFRDWNSEPIGLKSMSEDTEDILAVGGRRGGARNPIDHGKCDLDLHTKDLRQRRVWGRGESNLQGLLGGVEMSQDSGIMSNLRQTYFLNFNLPSLNTCKLWIKTITYWKVDGEAIFHVEDSPHESVKLVAKKTS